MTVINTRESDFNKDSIDGLIEEGVTELINLFRNDPDQFEYENELCYSFHDIMVRKLCKNDEFKIRWEQKSIMSYEGSEPSLESKFYAKYDLSLIKEKSDAVPFAFEFKLFPDLKYDNIDINYFTPYKIKKLIADINKLKNPDNKVDNGYILAFAYGNFSSINKDRIDRFKEKFEVYKVIFKNLTNIASTLKNNISIACVYFGKFEGEKPIFETFLYPDSFCKGINQNERKL